MLLYRYSYRPSAVHNTDARCKGVCIAAFSIAVLLLPTGFGGFAGLAALSALLLLTIIAARLPATWFYATLPVLLVWLPMLVLIPAFTYKGKQLAAGGIGAMLSHEGLGYGMGYGWKFLLFFLLSHLLVATTTISQLTKAISWYLRPLPHPAGAVISAIIGLTLAQIPALFDTYRQITQAQAARLGNTQKNPVKKLVNTLLPLLQTLFTRADELALAMEARCFTYSRTQYYAPIAPKYWAVTAVFCLLCGWAVWVGR